MHCVKPPLLLGASLSAGTVAPARPLHTSDHTRLRPTTLQGLGLLRCRSPSVEEVVGSL